MFCRDEHFQVHMRNLFVQVVQQVLQLFDETNDYNLSEHAELIETFYAFNTKIVKRLQVVYAEPNVDCVKLIHYGTTLLAPPSILSFFINKKITFY